MNLNNEQRAELIKKYRTELFETEDIDIKEIDELISDSDLKMMFSLNIKEMLELVNKKPVDEERIRKMFIGNINLYKIAKQRGVTIYGSSFLGPIANAINYDSDKLYAQLNVGEYHRPFVSR